MQPTRSATVEQACRSSTMVSMQVLSAAEMQTCDRATSERFGVPSLELMRAAGAAVAAFARQQFPQARRVTVLCGRGNNGGDGMMAARLLASAGLEVTTLLLGAPEQPHGRRGRGMARAVSRPAPWHAIRIVEKRRRAGPAQRRAGSRSDLDAVVGTGFKPPLKGLAAGGARVDQGQPTRRFSPWICPPAGRPTETAPTSAGPVFPADAVITFTAPKPAHVFGQLTRRWDQPSRGRAHRLAGGGHCLRAGSTTGQARRSRWRRRRALSRPTRATSATCWSSEGSVGKSGAPAMAALAALRAGAGLVTAAVPAPALAGGGRCAGVDDLAAGRDPRGLHFGRESCAGAGGRAHGGQDRAGHRPRHGTERGDGQIHHRACFRPPRFRR